ncbi:MAG TPA: MFS transporter [Ktedonobacterales bacterium]|nr:MFS transporter [Ktedonobacterales bacterium]
MDSTLSLAGWRRTAAQVTLLGAITLDTLLYGLVIPFLPGRALALGAAPVEVGALFATYSAGLLLATPPAGWLTDRFGARGVLLFGLLLLVAATLLFAFAGDLPTLLALPGVAGLWLLFGARAAQGMAAAITWTAGLALLAQLYPAQKRSAIFARVGLASGVGLLLGPPLGGALYTLGGFRAPFLFAAALALLDGVGRIIFLPGNAGMTRLAPEPGTTRSLLASAPFLIGLAAVVVSDLILTALDPTMPPLFTRQYGLTPLWIGLIFGGVVVIYSSAQSLAAVLTQRARPAVVIVVGLLLVTLGAFLLGNSDTLPATFVALGALGVAIAFVLIPALELLTTAGEAGRDPQRIPYGAIYALYNLAFSIGGLLGPLLATSSISLLGQRDGWLILGAPALLAAIWLTWTLLRRTQHTKS